MGRILLIERQFHTQARDVLSSRGHDVEAVADVHQAKARLAEAPFDLVVMEVSTDGSNGQDVLAELKQACDVAVLLVTEPSSNARAMEMVQAGAFAYVHLPVEAQQLDLLARRAIEHANLLREVQTLRAQSPVADVRPLAEVEKQVILSTLQQFKGHRVRTATALGIGVRTLGMKLKRWREEGHPIASRG